jgi:hypothetical protein
MVARIALSAALIGTSPFTASSQDLFNELQYPTIAETVTVLRYANTRCPDFGIVLTSDGMVFNGLIQQAQSRDPKLMEEIYRTGEREMATLTSLGFPAYCAYARSKYPGMFKVND